MTMVDISNKEEVFREATATGTIKLKNETILIPLCHQLPLTSVNVEVKVLDKFKVKVTSTVKTKAQTGVEMEALAATAISLLTVWDMVKQYEKDAKGQYPSTLIENIRVVKKTKEGLSNERKRRKT